MIQVLSYIYPIKDTKVLSYIYPIKDIKTKLYIPYKGY